MNLLIDPDLHATDKFNPRRPSVLIHGHAVVETMFGYYDADPATGPRCPRCNDLLHLHTWQLTNGTEVFECGRQT